MRGVTILLAAAAAVSLAACQERPKTVAGICKAFSPVPAASDGAAQVEDCLHRWAYALSASADDAGTVAEAVVAACGAPLSRWNQQGLAQGAPDGPSLLTGETTNPIAERANFAKNRALFYVVQGRAGGCKPPPKREGGPAMNTPEA